MHNTKPYSDNIVFFDTEFTSNDPITGEIMSLALIKLSGEELYLEVEYEGKESDWVKKNVTPFLVGSKVSKIELKRRVEEFMGNDKPYLVTFVNQFDFVYLCKLISYNDLPFNPVPIDFASILFGLGINPDDYKESKGRKLMQSLKIDFKRFRNHFALDDARLLREVYIKLLIKS